MYNKIIMVAKSNIKSDPMLAFTLGYYVFMGLITTFFVVCQRQGLAFDLSTFLFSAFLGFAGIIVNKSDDWIASLLGYAVTSIASGLMIAPIITAHPHLPVFNILGFFALLWLAGGITPKMGDYSKYITHTLAFLILARLVILLFPAWDLTAIISNWNALAALLFSGIVVYNVNRAMNSQDVSAKSLSENACSIYLGLLAVFSLIW